MPQENENLVESKVKIIVLADLEELGEQTKAALQNLIDTALEEDPDSIIEQGPVPRKHVPA